MIIVLYEWLIYLMCIFTIVLDLYLVIKICLFTRGKNGLQWSKKLVIINSSLVIINYLLLILALVFLFKPSSFHVLLLSLSYRDGLMVVTIILIVCFLLRFIILYATMNYMLFALNQNQLHLITGGIISLECIAIKTNHLRLVLEGQKRTQHYSFHRRSQLAQQLMCCSK